MGKYPGSRRLLSLWRKHPNVPKNDMTVGMTTLRTLLAIALLFVTGSRALAAENAATPGAFIVELARASVARY